MYEIIALAMVVVFIVACLYVSLRQMEKED